MTTIPDAAIEAGLAAVDWAEMQQRYGGSAGWPASLKVDLTAAIVRAAAEHLTPAPQAEDCQTCDGVRFIPLPNPEGLRLIQVCPECNAEPQAEGDGITRLPDAWEDEADQHTRDGYLELASGLRQAAAELTTAIRKNATTAIEAAPLRLTPAPQAEGDVREAIQSMLAEHGPDLILGSNRCLCGVVIHDESQYRSHIAGEFLASGLVVPVGEVERLRGDVAAARERLEHAIGERDRLNREWGQRYGDLRAKRDAALAAVERVRALHRPDGGAAGPGAMCVACTQDFGTPSEDPVAYPCPTAEALVDAAPAPTAIPARLLSGEHVGRKVVLPDGTRVIVQGIAHRPGGVLVSLITKDTTLAPDDVVTLVDETENDR